MVPMGQHFEHKTVMFMPLPKLLNVLIKTETEILNQFSVIDIEIFTCTDFIYVVIHRDNSDDICQANVGLRLVRPEPGELAVQIRIVRLIRVDAKCANKKYN